MKTFKALGMVASLGIGAVLVGCNPDEPAKTTTPPPSTNPPAVNKPAPKDTKAEIPKADTKPATKP
jgi:hypothetical protein